jgi:hypothetical protein
MFCHKNTPDCRLLSAFQMHIAKTYKTTWSHNLGEYSPLMVIIIIYYSVEIHSLGSEDDVAVCWQLDRGRCLI